MVNHLPGALQEKSYEKDAEALLRVVTEGLEQFSRKDARQWNPVWNIPLRAVQVYRRLSRKKNQGGGENA